MRILTLTALLSLAATPLAARAPSQEQALAGRTPGSPTSCITQSRIGDTTIFDSGAILYRMKAGPDYINAPGCPNLRHDRTIVSRTYSDQLCRGDILTIVDPPSGMGYGACPLADFVPYARMKKR
ncbi:hypothetical protein [Sphingomonas oryzagri]